MAEALLKDALREQQDIIVESAGLGALVDGREVEGVDVTFRSGRRAVRQEGAEERRLTVHLALPVHEGGTVVTERRRSDRAAGSEHRTRRAPQVVDLGEDRGGGLVVFPCRRVVFLPEAQRPGPG